MSDAEPEPALDADALAMLRAYRAEERIPADVHARVWSRVHADVAPPRGHWLRYAALAGGLAAAALAVLWLGGQVLRAEPRAPASQAGYERGGGAAEEPSEPRVERAAATSSPTPAPSRSAVAPAIDPGAAPSHAEPAPGGAGVAEPAPSRAPTRAGTPARADESARTPASAAPAPGHTLAEETRSLSRARAALVESKPEQALARLAEHAQRFPEGVLAEERQALRAVALCEAGRDADGEAAARAFLREHPQAALAERVRSACLE